ncbi:MAG: PEP/pyruvate-binding domain-containing protein [Candidatus Methylacidiphilales bacterium]|nr:PEP/pyruvate-binding domain-containing protein [Candidatus Methylacidiphilales bacterium]
MSTATLHYGGKARALSRLGATFPVPPWRVVLPEVFDASLNAVDPSIHNALAATRDYQQATELLRNLLPHNAWIETELPKIKADLELASSDRKPGKGSLLLAVRSSAIDEDGQQHSFAGQLESFLNVTWEELPKRIADVWRSGFSERIYEYRRQAGLSLPPSPPAVLVQVMVVADAAGVAFSADPVSGNRATAVVAAVRGLGDKLVSGDIDSDTFHVDRNNHVIERKLVEKAAAITDAQVVAIAELARKCAAHFGMPQDIEWAIEGRQLFLLQSRPITSLAQLVDPNGSYQLWDNSNISESYSGVTTPLTFSFARQSYEAVYRQFVAILGVPRHRIEANADTFSHMLGLIRGRVYYNMLSWYRVLAMLPGFSINRKFMEQMMGVKEPLPDEVMAEFNAPPAGWRDYTEVAGTVFGLIRNHWTLPTKVRAFYRRLDDVLNAKELPLNQMRAEELTKSFRDIQSKLLTHWDAPLINDFFAMIYYGVLRKLCEGWCGDRNATLQNDLVSGQGGMISAEPARRIQEMARLASKSPELLSILRDSPQHEIHKALANKDLTQAALAAAVAEYLEKFGERCLEELKLESATLHDDPLMLYRSIGRLGTHYRLNSQNSEAPQNNTSSNTAENNAAASLCAKAEAKAEEALQYSPFKRAVFSFVLKRARDRVRDRENLRFERTRVFGRARRIFVELGKRLHAENTLDDPRDIFWLTVEEAFAFVEGNAVSTDLRGLAALRKKEFEGYRHSMPAPADRFVTRGAVYIANKFQASRTASPISSIDSTTSQSSGSQRAGIGCCPGIVRGKVRVILSPRDAQMEVGEILVAPRTDPGWIMLFPSASGLLVEYGSLLSHSAIVAREMNIPAIVSVSGLTSWLATGDEVEFDGSTGRIMLLSKAQNLTSSAHV